MYIAAGGPGLKQFWPGGVLVRQCLEWLEFGSVGKWFGDDGFWTGGGLVRHGSGDEVRY